MNAPAQWVLDDGNHVAPFRHEIHTGNWVDFTLKKVAFWETLTPRVLTN